MTSIKMTDIDPALALKILNVKLGSILKIAEEIIANKEKLLITVDMKEK